MDRSKVAILVGLTLLLAGCSFFEGKENSQNKEDDLTVKGAVGSIAAVQVLEGGLATLQSRPSAALGLYITAYLSQGIFLPVHSAWMGIEAQKKLFLGQGSSSADETFTLLQELGNILQVNVSDILNRSSDRRETLDQYLQGMHNVYVLAERKKTELESSAEALRTEEREKRKLADDIDREIKRALENEDYTGAGSRQQELGKAQGKVAEVQTKREQTEDIGDRFLELLEVAQHRIVAIEANRLILIAGLQVVQLPGIEDLDILLEKGKRRNRNTSAFGTDQLE
ncbi:MAG: hypothetical protein Greene101449_121 [Candidatus Peregrinibacteria bacterium Greene1014_49]|nr:MAG: hypothetical protein Greene101449_121 [Candidatus Peregrinibacteria bacterium Greene1014_49]